MNLFNEVKSKVNELFTVKNTYDVKGKRFTEEKLLGEGGFGYVYLVSDEYGKKYALKKINIQESSQLQTIKRELNYWQSFNNHNNIVKLLSFDFNDKVALTVMEYSPEGNLFKYINDEFIEKNTYIKEDKALSIFYQIASAVSHIHSVKVDNKTIQHRDIKIENILKFGDTFKLCDFGSCSVESLDPEKVSKSVVKELFSKFERNTTFIYRPPEMVDEYSGFAINDKVDVWMMGCVLFVLLYKTHPFIEGQKSTIINAAYYFPATGIYSEKVDDLIRLMLTQNPKERPSSHDVLKILSNWKNVSTIPLPVSTQEVKKRQKRGTGVVNPEKSTSFNPVSVDELRAAQESILKKNKMGFRYKKDDDDISDVLEELNEGKDDSNNNKYDYNQPSKNQMPSIVKPNSRQYNNNISTNQNTKSSSQTKINNKNNTDDAFNDLFKETLTFKKSNNQADDFNGFIFNNNNNTQVKQQVQNSSNVNTNTQDPFSGFDNVFSNFSSQSNNNTQKTLSKPEPVKEKKYDLSDDMFDPFGTKSQVNQSSTIKSNPPNFGFSVINDTNNTSTSNITKNTSNNGNNAVNQNVFDFFN